MPYIILKRDDIPAGTLQVLDLRPNESQRSLIYETPGNTKYVNAVDRTENLVNADVAANATTRRLTGLGAWFLANVENFGGLGAPVDVVSTVDGILALYEFGNLAAPAGALTLVAINGAINGVDDITAGQLPDVLDILAGRAYTLPAGLQLGTGGGLDVQPALGEPGGPVFGPVRRTGDTSSLTLSFATGNLEGLTRNGYEVNGVGGSNGEAVVVVDDDGTLF